MTVQTYEMKQYVGWAVAGIILIVGYLFWPSPTIVHELGRIDTVYVDRVLKSTDTVMIPSRPEVVTIYRVDTVARKKAEAGNIITAVRLSADILEVDKLTPRGVGISQAYHLPELSTVLIDGNGQAQIGVDKKARRRKFWRKVEVIGVGIAGIFIGTKL